MNRDLINAFRHWLRTPIVTGVALLSLALGIGANVALFGVVDALLLKSLPVRDPQSLIRFVTNDPDHGAIDLTLSTHAWDYVRERQPFAESVLAVTSGRVNLARGGEVRYVPAVYISGTGLSTLGVEPVIGRVLQVEDDTDSAEPVAMISHALWQREYQGDPGALGETIWISSQPFTIVGVVPRSFYGLEVGQHADVFVPISGDAHIRRAAGNSPRRPEFTWLSLYARLKAGHTIEDATTALRAWIPELREATRPAGPDAESYLIHPASAVPGGQGESFLREQYQRPLFVLLGAVALVLVIACANLAALVLARFSDRRHELGVRLALGAGRARIIRMLVAESVLLAVAGGVLGLVFAQMFVGAMIPYLASSNGPRTELGVPLDARLLAFATATALLSGMVAGLMPAWRASRVTPQVSLAASSRGGTHGRRSTRALRFMVAGQVGISLVLVAGASVMVRSFIGLATAPTGVDADRVLIAQVSGTLAGADAATRYERIEEIRRALRNLPGVALVSGGMITPLSSSMAAAQVAVPGSIYKPGANDVRMNGRVFTPFNNVLPTYFAAIGTPILLGRDFDERDGPGTPPVAIVNQAFATRHYGEASPIGRTINVNGRDLEIVGLAADAKQMSLKDRTPVPLGYGAYTQLKNTTPISTLRFALRVEDPQAFRPAVATAIRGVDPRLSVEFRNMRDEASATINRERLMAWLAGIFAVLGLVMAVIGLYGTFTYAVTRRRSEIGVRMAVGANRADIVRMIMREAGVVLTAGLIVGLGGALAAGQILQSLLFSVSARDPWMLATAVASVIGAAGIASLIPARRASRTDPMVALREE
jgi:putative ABC transport system permease protein